MFRENENYKNLLDMHFDNSFSNDSRAEKGPKWNQKVATCNASEVEQRVWNRCCRQDAEKSDFLNQIVHDQFSLLDKGKACFWRGKQLMHFFELVFIATRFAR